MDRFEFRASLEKIRVLTQERHEAYNPLWFCEANCLSNFGG